MSPDPNSDLVEAAEFVRALTAQAAQAMLALDESPTRAEAVTHQQAVTDIFMPLRLAWMGQTNARYPSLDSLIWLVRQEKAAAKAGYTRNADTGRLLKACFDQAAMVRDGLHRLLHVRKDYATLRSGLCNTLLELRTRLLDLQERLDALVRFEPEWCLRAE